MYASIPNCIRHAGRNGQLWRADEARLNQYNDLHSIAMLLGGNSPQEYSDRGVIRADPSCCGKAISIKFE